MQASFFSRFFKRPPVVLPILALFLIALTLFEAVTFWGNAGEYHPAYLLRPALLLLYTFFWCAATLLKRRGAIAFILLTVINLTYFFFGPDDTLHNAIGDCLFPSGEKGHFNWKMAGIPLHLFMSVLLLFYFRKMK